MSEVAEFWAWVSEEVRQARPKEGIEDVVAWLENEKRRAEEALRRIDYAEFKVEDWLVKTELEDAKRALYRLKEKLEEVSA